MTHIHNWQHPLPLAASLAETGEHISLLYSAGRTGYSGRYSFLAWGVEEVLETWDAAQGLQILTPAMQPSSHVLPHWFGFIGYEALRAVEPSIPLTYPTPVALPVTRFVRYRHVLRFDHQQQRIEAEGETKALPPSLPLEALPPLPATAVLEDRMPEAAYLSLVEDALQHIHAGEFYQVNLTRKMAGSWAEPLTHANAFALFVRLCQLSPAPYSAFIAHESDVICSSSPELFLRAEADGTLTTRPIKGTAPLHKTAATLHHSIKDRAENLMIVDLMRNDLARCAEIGSVQVPQLFEVDNFSTLRHLSSSITAQRKAGSTLLEVLRATFPAGSMTGAPKIAAMRWIAEKERHDRGVYSGALGWIHGHQAEFSVVIRTLIANETRYEYQIGGGIVQDSDPKSEYAETHTKAAALLRALGYNISSQL